MVLESARPTNTQGLYLNEPLVFDFSHEVDPASVTSRSLRVELADGTRARGQTRVEGKRIVFEPAPVLSPELNDGGYLPGQRYRATLLGFPAPDGLRATTGEPLRETRLYFFTTVKDVDWPRQDFVFADDSPERCGPLVIVRDHIGSQDAILLGCEEPLDPSSLFAEDFLLKGAADELYPLQVKLIRNAQPEPGAETALWPGKALIELRSTRSLAGAHRRTVDDNVDGFAQRGRLRPPNLKLEIARDIRLADFSGNPIVVPPAYGIYVEDESSVGDSFRESATDAIRESFTTPQRRLPIRIRGVDGTAFWKDHCSVTVRYPAAAGLGSDGDVTLSGTEQRRDIHAISLDVSELGAMLSNEPGLCVVRAQGKLVISGRLERRTEGTVDPMRWSLVPEPEIDAFVWLQSAAIRSGQESWQNLAKLYEERIEKPSWDDLRDWFDLAGREELRPDWEDLRSILVASQDHPEDRAVLDWADRIASGRDSSPTLTAWLENAREMQPNWTVLIAGGDLEIDGEVWTDTPLLLVAGGMIRVRGEVHAGRSDGTGAGEVYLLGEGGGQSILRRTAPLVIDPPQYNPLVRPMSFAVLSKQIPQEDGPIHWSSAVEVHSENRPGLEGQVTVRYVRDVPALEFDPERAELFVDPSLFTKSGPIHFYVRFDIPAAPSSDTRGRVRWNPPLLDEIILTPKKD